MRRRIGSGILDRIHGGDQFSFEGLPPDDYLVVATMVDAGAETDPDQLEQWRKVAAPVALPERATRSVTILMQR